MYGETHEMKDECVYKKNIDVEDEKHLERTEYPTQLSQILDRETIVGVDYKVLLIELLVKYHALEERLKERDSVRLWNENEELKAKFKIAKEAIRFIVYEPTHDQHDNEHDKAAIEAWEKIK